MWRTSGARNPKRKPMGHEAKDRGVASRRQFLRQSALASALVVTTRPLSRDAEGPVESSSTLRPFELDELTINDLRQGMKSGRFTARSLAEMYLGRIEEVDKRGPAVNSIIEINPDALAIADALDSERKEKGPRGPLHG